jgi:prepilin-type N-terminal cleavage/methylation domain-containing protein
MIKSKCSRGFTLLELVATIVILSVVAAIGSRILQTSFNAFYQNQYITDANAQGRLALERMSRDIHSINSPASIISATSSQLAFVNTSGNSMSFLLSGTQLWLNNQVLADGVNVGSSSFTYLDENAAITTTLANIRYVIINLVLTQGGVNYTLRTTANTINFT